MSVAGDPQPRRRPAQSETFRDAAAFRASVLEAARAVERGAARSLVVEGDTRATSVVLGELVSALGAFTSIWVSAHPSGALPYALADALAARLGEGDPHRLWSQAVGHPEDAAARLGQAFIAAAQTRPLLAVIDRAEFADPESLEALGLLARRLAAERVLLVVSGAGGEDEAWQRLVTWSRGTQEPQDGVPVLQVPAGPEVAARADPAREAPPALRAVLESISIFQAPAPLRTLQAMSPELDVEVLCQAGADQGLLTWIGGARDQIDFRSHADRDAVRRDLGIGVRRTLHARAAESSLGFDRLWHLVEAAAGPDPALAADLLRAADSAIGEIESAYCQLWASRLAEDPDARARALCEAACLFVLGAREAEGLRLLADIATLSPAPARAEALGMLALAQQKVASARDHLTQAEATASDAGQRGRILVELAYAHGILGDGGQAVESASAALAADGEGYWAPIAQALLAGGEALRIGPAQTLRTLDLPEAPHECTSAQIPLLTSRGIWRGLVGRLSAAESDLDAAASRRDGMLTRVMGASAFIHLFWCRLQLGDWTGAQHAVDFGMDYAAVHGRSFDRSVLSSSASVLCAYRGEAHEATRHLARARTEAASADYAGPRFHLTMAEAAGAHARFDSAGVAAALDSFNDGAIPDDRLRLYGILYLPVLIGSQIAGGELDLAEGNLDRMDQLTAQGSAVELIRSWLRAVLWRAQGQSDRAIAAMRAAAQLPRRGGDPRWYRALLLADLGRTLMGSGEAVEGRARVTEAHALFAAMGAAPFAKRCEDDLATGDAPAAGVSALLSLTAREREVATYVGRGWTNQEIARKLYLSPKTVEYHLRNVYMKCDITSRRELRDAIQQEERL